jgi:hypothetical protein
VTTVVHVVMMTDLLVVAVLIVMTVVHVVMMTDRLVVHVVMMTDLLVVAVLTVTTVQVVVHVVMMTVQVVVAALTVTTVHLVAAVLIVMTVVLVATLIAKTRAQRRNVSLMKLAVAPVDVAQQGRCRIRQSDHVKTGLMKARHGQRDAPQVCVRKRQEKRKRVAAKKFERSTLLLKSLNVRLVNAHQFAH